MDEQSESEAIEELRNRIWDFVYRAGNPQSVDSIVADMSSTDDLVRSAVDHDWFSCEDDMVAIA